MPVLPDGVARQRASRLWLAKTSRIQDDCVALASHEGSVSVTDDEKVRVDSLDFLLPLVRPFRAIAEKRITRNSVYEIKAGGIYCQFLPNGQTSQKAKIVLRANNLRKAQSILSQFLEWGRALRIYRESCGMVVIAADCYLGLLSHPLDYLMRIRAVVDQIADAPQLVEIALWQCIQGREVAMNIGDDDDLQDSSIPCAETVSACVGGEMGLLEDPCEQATPRRNLTRGYHLFVHANEERKEQRLRRTPSPRTFPLSMYIAILSRN